MVNHGNSLCFMLKAFHESGGYLSRETYDQSTVQALAYKVQVPKSSSPVAANNLASVWGD